MYLVILYDSFMKKRTEWALFYHLGDFLDLLSSLTPCVLGYGEIGLNCQNSNPKTLMYKKWIETYSSIEYQDVCSCSTETIAVLNDARPSGHPRGNKG